MSAIEKCIDMINENGLCAPTRNARAELTKLRARIAELEDMATPPKESPLTLADKVEAHRRAAQGDALIGALLEAGKWNQHCWIEAMLTLRKKTTEAASLTTQVEALTAERDRYRDQLMEHLTTPELFPCTLPALKGDEDVVLIIHRGGPIGGGPKP